MNLQQIIYVVKIAEYGSLSSTAEALFVSQPTLTQAVSRIEKEIGIRLFNRSQKGISLTPEGAEFIGYAKELSQQFDNINERYGKNGVRKKKFSISTQHYSFAVKAFVDAVKAADSSLYEFSIMETRTYDVIADVAGLRSEVGILFMSDFNRSAIKKFLSEKELTFVPLVNCRPYVFMSKGHPLAEKKSLRFDDLKEFPCLTFDQGDSGSLYYSEEMLPEKKFPQVIKTADRATMMNLMNGLDGYTICTGIICPELNGSDYVAIPFCYEDGEEDSHITIGYITKKNVLLSTTGELFIKILREYLVSESENLQ